MNEFNLTPQDTYLVMKLCTGEQLIAVQRSEDQNNLVIEYPMLVKSYAFQADEDSNEVSENVTASPYCKFSEDKIFTFRKTDLIFVKKMHKFAIPFYVNLVKEYENTIEAIDTEDSNLEELAEKVDKIIRSINERSEAEEPMEKLSEEQETLLRTTRNGNTFH